MPISSFGIFATILMLSNYLLVITSFPAILINIEKFYEWKEKRAKRKIQPKERDEEETTQKKNGN